MLWGQSFCRTAVRAACVQERPGMHREQCGGRPTQAAARASEEPACHRPFCAGLLSAPVAMAPLAVPAPDAAAVKAAPREFALYTQVGAISPRCPQGWAAGGGSTAPDGMAGEAAGIHEEALDDNAAATHIVACRPTNHGTHLLTLLLILARAAPTSGRCAGWRRRWHPEGGAGGSCEGVRLRAHHLWR